MDSENWTTYYNLSSYQDMDFQARRLGSILTTYILPVIVFSGLVGNTISSFVFTTVELRKLSSSIHIFALLVSDTGVLIGLLFVWLEAIGYGLNHLNGICQGVVFFTYVFSFLSVWYVVCVTVENYITICHPSRFKSMCTRRRATITVTSIALLSLTLYAFTAFSTHVLEGDHLQAPQCSHRSEFEDVLHVLTYVDSVVTLFVPLLAISFMLIPIALNIFRSSRWRKRLSTLPMLDGVKMGTVGETRRNVVRKSPRVRVAKMLLALSVSYVVMNAPSHVCRMYFLIRPRDLSSAEMTYTEGLVLLIFQYVSYCHHAIKFWLFAVISRNFNKHLKKTLCYAFQSGCCKCH